jgi:hypothetical protein
MHEGRILIDDTPSGIVEKWAGDDAVSDALSDRLQVDFTSKHVRGMNVHRTFLERMQ